SQTPTACPAKPVNAPVQLAHSFGFAQDRLYENRVGWGTHIRAVDEKNKRPSMGHPAYKVAALDGFNRL
ncbi:MAG TPA: hypothetical protein VII23_03440, partial [Terriglobales bacterium]